MSILVATDFSDRSKPAVRTAVRLADARKTRLKLIHCIDAIPGNSTWGRLADLPEDAEMKLRKSAMEKFEEFFDEMIPALEQPKEVEFRVEITDPVDGIVALVDDPEEEIELVIVGATGMGRVMSFLLGSTAEDVVRRSSKPVLVVPEDDPAESWERIVAPVDFSDCSRASLELAVDLAGEHDARLDILHSYFPPTAPGPASVPPMSPEATQSYEERIQRRFDSFVAKTDLSGIDAQKTLGVGTPVEVITERIEDWDADLVVMGTHGRTGVERLFLGSTTTKVVRTMPCPVLTLRRED